jgi:selenoprotein W-related protein
MAEELLEHYHKGLGEVRLVPSSGGCFEVSADGRLLFSKLKEGRFPEFGEIKRLIDSL